MGVAAEPAPREQPSRPNTSIDTVLYHKLKTTLEVIFVYVWVEFITQYQFNELDKRMLKLEKGQTITKTAEEKAVELDGEMSMGAKLIGKFVTQQVTVAMAKKSREYGKKTKKLEKGGKYRVSGESSRKNGTRGGGRASKKKESSKTLTTTKSGPPWKYASLLAQGQKSILRSPLRGRSQQVGAADSGAHEKGKKKKAACSKSAS